MNLKVLWLTSSFPVHPENGRNLYLWHPLQALKKMGVEPVVLNTQSWKPFSRELIETPHFLNEIVSCNYLSIPRHYLRIFSNYSYKLRVVSKIKELHKLHHFDVIHAHGEICGLAAVAAAKKLGIRAVVTVHGIDTCERVWKGFAGKMFRDMFNRADRIIYVGKPLQAHFSGMMETDKHCRVVHNGFRVPAGQQQAHKIFENKRSIHLISVSNLHEGKGVDLTLRALAQLKKQGIENWFYTIIGSGDQKKHCEHIIAEFDLSKQVKFMGTCNHETIYSRLEKADIFCLPSYREAFGIAYVEAMAHGLLTVGVKGQGPQAFIEHGKTGLLVEPKNINDLTQTIYLAITQFENMQEIAAAGKAHVLENFTWQKHAEKLLVIYNEVC